MKEIFDKETGDEHKCPESEGKIVWISCDNSGVTRCGYCNVQIECDSELSEEVLEW